MANTYPTTQFPLGSTEVKVLFNNASNFDDAMNSELPSFCDRFNKRRETWAGMQKMVADFLEAMGFEATHLVYVDGTPLTVLRPTQLIDRAGSVYKVKQPASFPVNLTGTWATDQLLLVDVTDSSLRTDLATQGAAIIFGAQQTVASIAALRLLLKTSISTFASVLGYYSLGDGGGGHYWLDIADSTSIDNGGSIIVAADGGRWKISQAEPMTLRQWGCKGDDVTDDTAGYLAAVNSGLPFHVPVGKFKVAPIGPTVVYPTGSEPNRTSGAVLATGQNVTGEGAQSELIWNNATKQAFFGVTNSKNITISDIKFTGGYAPFIVDPVSNGSVDNIGLLNCIVDGCITGPIGGRQLALDPAAKSSSNIWMVGCDVRNIIVHAFMVSNCDRAWVMNNHFENINGGFCCDFSQGTRGGILADNTALNVQYFGKAESSNSYVGGGVINADPLIAASRDISVTGNTVAGLQLIGFFANSAADRVIVTGNNFAGSISVGIDCGQVTGFAHAGQLVISDNIINAASINAIGIRSAQTVTTTAAIVQGNTVNGGTIGIAWLPNIGLLADNVLNTIDLGIQLNALSLNGLTIQGNLIKSNTGIGSVGTGAWQGLSILNNRLEVVNYGAYLGTPSSISDSAFSGNTTKNLTVKAPGSLLINNPRSFRITANNWNLATGSGASVQTVGTALKSMLSGNIATVGFTVAGPDGTTTANTVTNIIDATPIA